MTTVLCHATWSHEPTEMVEHDEYGGTLVCPECGMAVDVEPAP